MKRFDASALGIAARKKVAKEGRRNVPGIGACQPSEQVEEDSSKEATGKGSSGEKSTIR